MDKTRKPYPTKAKERIQAGMILRLLHDHIAGKAEMSATQIQAARILLGKVLPDLKAVEQSGTVDVKQWVINAMPEQAAEEWATSHKSSGVPSQDRKPH